MSTATNINMERGRRVVGFLLILSIVVSVNVILGNTSWRLDVTQDKVFSLSSGTKQVLRGLKAPVKIKFFFNSSDSRVPIIIKQHAQRISDLLEEYERVGKGKIVVQKFDPEPDSDAEDQARLYGVQGFGGGPTQPNTYLGIVVSMGDSDEVMPIAYPRLDDLLEYNITRMIASVSNPKKPVVGVISSLPVLGSRQMPYPIPGQPPPAPPWAVFSELQKSYDVRELSYSIKKIPPDVDTIILIHPKEDLSEETRYALDQFVLRGGGLLLFVDPWCRMESEQAQTPQDRFQGNSSDLPELLEAWGVSYDPGKVVADLEGATQVPNPDGRIETSPVRISLSKDCFNSQNVLTAQLELVDLVHAGALSVAQSTNNTITVTPLITSSASSCLVDASKSQFNMRAYQDEIKPPFKKYNFAISLAGKLKTAFPDGRPKPDEDTAAEDKEKALDPDPSFFDESIQQSRIIIVSDVDFMHDRHAFRVLGRGINGWVVEPRNDNAVFVLGLVENLTGGAALAQIRARGKTDRPFESVRKLKEAAAQKQMAEEHRLEKEVKSVEKKISDLQSRRSDNHRFWYTPEQQAELDRLQDSLANTNERLKKVRRAMYANVDRLGMKVKAINILLIPVAIAIAGVCLQFFRRRKVGT